MVTTSLEGSGFHPLLSKTNIQHPNSRPPQGMRLHNVGVVIVPPPKYKPKQKPIHPIEVSFAADPFDPRFVGKDRRLTPLGIMVQTFHYLRSHLIAAAPDAVDFLENQNDTDRIPQ